MQVRKPNLNAYKHGLTGQTLILEPEDKPVYDAHCKSYFDLYKPVGRPEELLVQMIADDYWRALRGRSLENALMSRIIENNALLTLDPREEKQLNNLALYLRRIENSIRNNTKALKEMQADRVAQNRARKQAEEPAQNFVFSQSAKPAPSPAPPAPGPLPLAPEAGPEVMKAA